MRTRKEMNANDERCRSYMFGNTRHEIHEYPEKKGRNDWTVVVGEDNPRAYSSILAQWAATNIVGRAMTVDLADEDGLLELLTTTTGRVRLGDRDGNVDVDGIDPELTIVI